MSERKFSRSYDMPTVNPDEEDTVDFKAPIEGRYERISKCYSSNGYNIKLPDDFIVDVKTSGKAHCPVIKKTARDIIEDRNRPHVCNHKWKSYVGLSESFDYCTICDEKRK